MKRQSVYKFAYYPDFNKLHEKLLDATDDLSYFDKRCDKNILLNFLDVRYHLAMVSNGVKTSKNKKYTIFNTGLRSTNNYPLYAIYYYNVGHRTFLKFDTRKCVEISGNFIKRELPKFCILNSQIPTSIDFTDPNQFYYIKKHIIDHNIKANLSPKTSNPSHVYRIPKKLTNMPNAKKYIQSQIDSSILYIHEQLKNGVKASKIFAPFDYVGNDHGVVIQRKGFFLPISFTADNHRYVMVMAVEKDKKGVWVGKTIYEVSKAIKRSYMWMNHKNYYMRSKFAHANDLEYAALNK